MAPARLPDNDPDLKLARRIGEYLDGDNSSNEGNDDPLAEVLNVYKQHAQNHMSDSPVPTQTLWEHIDQRTRPQIPSSTPFNSLSGLGNKVVWAAAAVIIITALTGIFYFTVPHSPVLLAEAESSIQTITLSDGSIVTLRPNSRLYKLQDSDDSASYHLVGEGFFSVRHQSGRMFSVEAGNGRINVLGTQFNLSSWGDITQVYLEEGSIQFTHIKSRESVILKPGESLMVSSGTSTAFTAAANAEFYTDWMQEQLVFDNKPAEYVFKELEHHYNITISAPELILNTRISSGGLSLEHEKTSLEFLGLVLGGSFRSDGPETYTFVANN